MSGLFEVSAATAISADIRPASRIWFSDPHVRLTVGVDEPVAVGSYWDHEGRICRVVRVEYAEDWFADTKTLVMTNGPVEDRLDGWGKYEGAFVSILRKLPSRLGASPVVNWLEDTFLPRLTP